MVAAHLRPLASDDESLVELAYRTFGLDGDIDATAFLARPETALLVVQAGDAVAGASRGGSDHAMGRRLSHF